MFDRCRVERGGELGQLAVGLHLPVLLRCLFHPPRSPAKPHLAIPPALHVPGVKVRDVHGRLDRVGGGERPHVTCP